MKNKGLAFRCSCMTTVFSCYFGFLNNPASWTGRGGEKKQLKCFFPHLHETKACSSCYNETFYQKTSGPFPLAEQCAPPRCKSFSGSPNSSNPNSIEGPQQVPDKAHYTRSPSMQDPNDMPKLFHMYVRVQKKMLHWHFMVVSN